MESSFRQKILFGIRTKLILLTVISLLISAPISTFIEHELRYGLGFHVSAQAGTLINTAISIIVTTILIAISFQFIVIRNIHKIIEVVSRWAKGDFRHRVAIRSKDELGRLSVHMNEMADEISRLLQAVQSASN
ncbi:HAMP domain-containing protein [Alicyclobacillus tolerans]|uniref:Methyl-accepting chemotaxis protein n=1 Tax=Alicyclobacillus tolerans TaxID=90970 RepID=A0ABT9LX21_9BACL|nr:HAMP domain-containing protein [Alicyclobacillus tengchongensis]MDP9728807.1 methyl-accepting chemotaxis protein [Alicyclobacillus tengchongensis]